MWEAKELQRNNAERKYEGELSDMRYVDESQQQCNRQRKLSDFFSRDADACAEFKTAAEYNAFPVTTSRSSKIWNVRLMAPSWSHCQHIDEDD